VRDLSSENDILLLHVLCGVYDDYPNLQSESSILTQAVRDLSSENAILLGKIEDLDEKVTILRRKVVMKERGGNKRKRGLPDEEEGKHWFIFSLNFFVF
jgi:hypothetical protein